MEQTIVMVGVAGSGRHSALGYLEDMGFTCFPKFLPALIPALLTQVKPATKLVIELELRDVHDGVIAVQDCITQIKASGRIPLLLFLEATPATLLGRYALTRRPHPLLPQTQSLEEAIDLDHHHLAGVRALAHQVLDTSLMSVKELRTHLENLLHGQIPAMVVTLMSFGYKYTVPAEANLVFDIRFLPNPFYQAHLKPLTGLDAEVVEYIFESPLAHSTFEHIAQSVHFFLGQYRTERRGQVCVAIGCTGGQHRSVAFVERLAPRLDVWQVRVKHREQELRHRGHA